MLLKLQNEQSHGSYLNFKHYDFNQNLKKILNLKENTVSFSISFLIKLLSQFSQILLSNLFETVWNMKQMLISFWRVHSGINNRSNKTGFCNNLNQPSTLWQLFWLFLKFQTFFNTIKPSRTSTAWPNFPTLQKQFHDLNFSLKSHDKMHKAFNNVISPDQKSRSN